MDTETIATDAPFDFDVAEDASLKDFEASKATAENSETESEGKPATEPEPKEKEGEATNQEGSEPKAEEDQQPETAKPKEPASSEGEEENKGALPESLKPFETLLTSRGWANKPLEEVAPEILKSYKEMESVHGMRGREVGLLNDRAKEISKAALGSLDDLNSYRKNQGLPAIVGAKPASEQLTSQREMAEKFRAALNSDESATQWLADKIQEDLSELQYRARREEETAGSTHSDPNAAQVTFQQNLNALSSKHPDSNVTDVMNSIYQDPQLGPLLDSHGLNGSTMFSSPERADAWFSLANAVKSSREMEAKEKAFNERVEAEVKQRLNFKQQNKNKGANGQGNPPASDSETDSATQNKAQAEEFEYMTGGGINF